MTAEPLESDGVLTPDETELDDLLGPLRLRYTPVYPHPKQEWFLLRDELECFFGGAAGPGKSWALLMAALQFCDVPGYNALILRPVLEEFYKPKALIPVSTDWLAGEAAWNGSLRQWTFPSGATLSFGYLRTRADLGHFKGPAYAFVGFDELTEFADESLYRGMFRVLRDPPEIPGSGGAKVPLRMRSASNPGGPGHGWVKTRLVDPASREKDAVFIPATIDDNPSMNYDEYLVSLSHLAPVDRERLIRGDWDVTEEGGVFDRLSFRVLDAPLPGAIKRVRYWDLAATEEGPAASDPDYTVGTLMEWLPNGWFQISDVARGRWGAAEVEAQARARAQLDGPGVPVVIEQEPGAAGKSLLSYWQRHVLPGYSVKSGLTRIPRTLRARASAGEPPKQIRARPWAAAVANGLAGIVRGPHVGAFLDEHALFPKEGVHDDTIDSATGAHTYLTRGVLAPATVHRAKGRIVTGPTGGPAPAASAGARAPLRPSGRLNTDAASRRR